MTPRVALMGLATLATGCAAETPSRYFNEQDLPQRRVEFVKSRGGLERLVRDRPLELAPTAFRRVDRLQAQVAREGGRLFPEVPPLQ